MSALSNVHFLPLLLALYIVLQSNDKIWVVLKIWQKIWSIIFKEKKEDIMNIFSSSKGLSRSI